MKQLFFLFLLISTSLYAQEKNCGSNLSLNEYIKANTKALQNRAKLEKQTTEFKFQKGVNTTIPVVVHVVYKNANENISDAQIAFYHRAKCNSTAAMGRYNNDIENEV